MLEKVTKSCTYHLSHSQQSLHHVCEINFLFKEKNFTFDTSSNLNQTGKPSKHRWKKKQLFPVLKFSQQDFFSAAVRMREKQENGIFLVHRRRKSTPTLVFVSLKQSRYWSFTPRPSHLLFCRNFPRDFSRFFHWEFFLLLSLWFNKWRFLSHNLYHENATEIN